MSASKKRPRLKTRQAVAQATRLADVDEHAPTADKLRGRFSDPFSAQLRREVLPLLVLHFITDTPSYGNQLIERVSAITAGVLSVNPNTMYPLLRQLESQGLIEGRWEHPQRRSRRYYSITDAGIVEYKRLVAQVQPFLGSLAASIHDILVELSGAER
jgi:PadR family transcriptional regulator, regulatory protein PadR